MPAVADDERSGTDPRPLLLSVGVAYVLGVVGIVQRSRRDLGSGLLTLARNGTQAVDLRRAISGDLTSGDPDLEWSGHSFAESLAVGAHTARGS